MPGIRVALLVPVAALAIGIAAGCGSGDDQAVGPAAGYGGAPPTTAAPSPSSAGAATVSTAGGDLGVHLVDADGRTLYLWEKDTGSTSTCTGACASAWPPLLTDGAPAAAGDARAGLLGTAARPDGTTAVTYAGHPLYRFAGDSAPGDANGQESDAFGAEWYVLAPSGAAIESAGEGS